MTFYEETNYAIVSEIKMTSYRFKGYPPTSPLGGIFPEVSTFYSVLTEGCLFLKFQCS